MCGILGIFGSGLSSRELRAQARDCAKLLRHRGPDWGGIYIYPENGQEVTPTTISVAIAHERLAIVDPESGAQPLVDEITGGKLVLAVNGEIYNHQAIRGDFKDHDFKTKSDCEVILPLFKAKGAELLHDLKGMFSFVLWDEAAKTYFAARDHIGIIPLYVGWMEDGGVVFASELKALQGICPRFELFPPGHHYSSADGKFVRWYEPIWRQPGHSPTADPGLLTLRAEFEQSVVRRMMSDVPWGCLLSGGLDSSLVASIACRHAARVTSFPKMHSFTIGLEGSPDLEAAAKVAEFLGTVHHAYKYTVQDGLDALSDVIYHLETYDVTTIRASTPMFLMARKIKAMGVKMVLSGEGADEALAGYLYFHKAPNGEELQKETVRKLGDLHFFDCLRANKSMSAFGVEPRVPFLDKDFLEFCMNVDPTLKMCKVREGDEKRGSIEKYWLRKAFDTPDYPYLPDEVLWRQKEQFSDGVGYGWIDGLRDNAEANVSEQQWAMRARRFPKNTPATKEAYFYRSIFNSHFPSESATDSVKYEASIACSTAKAIEWDAEFQRLANECNGDCSGRAVVSVHNDAYEDVLKVVTGGEKDSSKRRKVVNGH